MSAIRRRLPGGGFLLLVAGWGGLAGFLGWGLGEPDLDRAWRLLHEADRGVVQWTAADYETLDRCMTAHPEIAFDRLGGKRVKFLERTTGGWTTEPQVHLVVGPLGPEGLRLRVECRGARRYPVTVELEAGGFRRSSAFAGDGEAVVELPVGASPHGPGRPFLARVRVSGTFDRGAGAAETAGIRITAGTAGGGS
ncbi:MAG: hypothetical protein QME96_06750 [Myxococcota bacterium]|nr:hypothetical protein [Myxococcota bacterium]